MVFCEESIVAIEHIFAVQNSCYENGGYKR